MILVVNILMGLGFVFGIWLLVRVCDRVIGNEPLKCRKCGGPVLPTDNRCFVCGHDEFDLPLHIKRRSVFNKEGGN